MLGQDARRVFKTLVTEGKSRAHYVFMVPVAEELDLKKAAALRGRKGALHAQIEGTFAPHRLRPRRLFAHRHEKSRSAPWRNETAKDFDTILFSAGKIGLQIETSLADLQKAVPVELADVIVS